MPVVITPKKLVDYFRIRAVSVYTIISELGWSVFAPISSMDYLTALHLFHQGFFAVIIIAPIPAVSNRRYQVSKTVLLEPYYMRIQWKRFEKNLNVAKLYKLLSE